MGICPYNKEIDLKNHPNPISSDKMLYILELIKRCICLIKCPKGGHGTGFFCRIHDQNFLNFKTVLITNFHILKEDDLNIGKKIEFTLNHDTINKELIITDDRKIYANEEFDITIIDLDPQKDSIKQDSFLDVDRQLFSEEPNEKFKNKDIYIIGDIKEFTYGKIKYIDVEGINIGHLCSTKKGMSGSPIINLNDHRIIGVHKGSHPLNNWNLGTFLRDPIKQYYAKNDNFIDKNNKIKESLKQYDDDNENISYNKNNKILIDIPKAPRAVSLEIGKSLIEKMERQICKVEHGFGDIKSYDTGFFCNIHYAHNMILKTLIISGGTNISIGSKIKFSINDNKIKYEIVLDKSRRIYKDSKYGISIIELKPNDGLKEISFCEIDDRIFKEDKNSFRNKDVFLLHYGMGKMKYSAGIIIRIEENNYIIYKCDSAQGSGVGPIINSLNFQVIGVHIGKNKEYKCELGIFLKETLLNFYKNFGLYNS